MRLARFRWWHVEQVLPVERALFGDEPWTARTFWSELGQVDTRHYLVALDDDRVLGPGTGSSSVLGYDTGSSSVLGSGTGSSSVLGSDTGSSSVLGYAGLCDYPDEAWVQTLAVAPQAQGRGVGGRLLTALLEVAEALGQRTVALEVRADNAPAQALYARHGFAQTGVRRGYYQPSGVDALVLQRRA